MRASSPWIPSISGTQSVLMDSLTKNQGHPLPGHALGLFKKPLSFWQTHNVTSEKKAWLHNIYNLLNGSHHQNYNWHIDLWLSPCSSSEGVALSFYNYIPTELSKASNVGKSNIATPFWTVQIVSKIKMIILQDPDWNLKPFIEILNICGSKAEG